MKKFILTIALLAAALCGFAKDKEAKDSTGIKTGLNFGPLPAIGYSTDLGWHYGALSDIYWYGDGSVYPDYVWKANVEISRYSKGNTVFHTFFDSKYLIPGLRVSAAVSYFLNNTYNFYGFNGNASLYNKELDRIVPTTNGDIAAGFGNYIMKRDIFRIMGCIQGTFGDSNWGWAAGLNYTWFRCGDAKNRGLNAKAKESAWEQIPSLYQLYLDNGIIPAAEAAGGHHLEFKAGFVYDTRDHENMPSEGTNLEVYAFGSPDFMNKRAKADRTSYLKLAIHFKQFFPLVGDKLVFGVHAAYQGLIAGKAPFYSLQSIQSLNMKQINTEGLGSTCTLRGTVSNRLMGDGYAWGNLELRWKFLTFDWINQHWALALNPFFDMGGIVQPYHLQEMKDARHNWFSKTADQKTAGEKAFEQQLALLDPTHTVADYLYTGVEDNLHFGAGVGLHVIMNTNFNVSFEFAKCINPFYMGNDGVWGMNIGLNYIF